MQNSNRLNHIVLSLIDYWYLWVIPLLLGGGLALCYSLFLHTPTYTARQSLIVRDDLMGDSFKPSRFESLDSMKSAQETILEIARKPEVVRNVMEQMEEEDRSFSFFGNGGGVSDADIEDMQGNIEFGAPNGAEFGRTEAVVLTVTTQQREQAKIFTNLLLDAIDSKLSDVRRQRLNSMEQELALASESSKKLLAEASGKLQEIERGLGTEITTIRELNDPQGGNAFDQKLNQIRQEKREAVSTLASAREQRVLLENAQANNSLVTSSQLLEMQPSLAVMMGSLNTAREALSINEGRYKPLHPALKASREAVRHQEAMLFKSLGPTILGVDSQIAMAESKVVRLDRAIAKLEDKLMGLTEQRVPYAKLQEDVTNKTKMLSDVQAKLSQVRSYTSSSENIGLLTRVGEPQVGSRPNGLGKRALILVGLVGGLLIGLGLVALAVPPSGSPVAYQPVMMPVSGTQMAPAPNNQFREAPRNEAPLPASPPSPPATPPAPTAPIVSATPVDETVSESRLKSVAQQVHNRKQADTEAQAKSGSPSLMSNDLDSVIPESVAKHMAELKNKSKAVLTPSAQQAEVSTPKERSRVSSEDVIAAFKNSAGKAGAAAAGATVAAAAAASSAASLLKPASPTPKPEKVPSESIDAIQNKLRQLEASETKSRQQEKLRALDPTITKPDIVVVERKKTMAPDVPASIAAGRITAESLIESSAKRVQTQSEELPDTPSDTSQPRQNIQSSPDEDSSRIPSITDYARSLETNVIDNGANQGSGELQDPSDSTLPMERRPSNVRPVDIAKSLAEHDSVRGIVDDIRPNESDSSSTHVANQRSTEETIPSKVADNSLVGLMREARKSNPEVVRRKSDSDVSVADLKPTSKTSEKSPTPSKTETKLAGKAKSGAIPEQIKELSDSISSFARPTGKSSGPKE